MTSTAYWCAMDGPSTGALPKALMPFLWLVICHMARNKIVNGTASSDNVRPRPETLEQIRKWCRRIWLSLRG